MQTFAEYLRSQRNAKGMSRSELADALGISYSTISSVEQNRKQASPKMRVKIQNYFEDMEKTPASGSFMVGDIIKVHGISFRIADCTFSVVKPPTVELVSIIEELEI